MHLILDTLTISRTLLVQLALLFALPASFFVSGASLASVTNTVGTGGFVAESPSHNGGGDFTNAATGTAGNNDPLSGYGALLFFELPDLSADPVITAAELTVTLNNARDAGVVGDAPFFDADLYFLGLRSALVINKPDDYGDSAVLPVGATLVQAGWWVANDDSQIGTSKTIDVTSSILSAYTAGAPNDNYAVFALYADWDLTVNSFTTYFFGITPELDVTHEPEPPDLPALTTLGQLALLGVIAIAGVWLVLPRRSS